MISIFTLYSRGLLRAHSSLGHLSQWHADERLELAEYVRWRATQDDPDWQAELGRRRDRLAQSGGHSRDELLRLHDKLSAEGK